jgi:hypothetical protein
VEPTINWGCISGLTKTKKLNFANSSSTQFFQNREVTLGRRNKKEKERFSKGQCRKKKGPTDYLPRRRHKNRLESLLTTAASLSEGRKPCRVACSFPSPSHFNFFFSCIPRLHCSAKWTVENVSTVHRQDRVLPEPKCIGPGPTSKKNPTKFLRYCVLFEKLVFNIIQCYYIITLERRSHNDVAFIKFDRNPNFIWYCCMLRKLWKLETVVLVAWISYVMKLQIV